VPFVEINFREKVVGFLPAFVEALPERVAGALTTDEEPITSNEVVIKVCTPNPLDRLTTDIDIQVRVDKTHGRSRYLGPMYDDINEAFAELIPYGFTFYAEVILLELRGGEGKGEKI